LAGEGELAGLLVDVERGDVVAALIAAGEELAAGIEREAAGVVAAGCGFADIREVAVLSDREDGNGVVHAVARVNEADVGRDQNLRAEVAPREPRRQRRDSLARNQSSRIRLEVESSNCRSFFLDKIHALARGSESEVTRTIAGRQRCRGQVIRTQLA